MQILIAQVAAEGIKLWTVVTKEKIMNLMTDKSTLSLVSSSLGKLHFGYK